MYCAEPAHDIAARAITANRAEVRDLLRNYLGTRIEPFDWATHANTIRALVDRMRLGFPPNEVIEQGIEKRVSFACLMNAGWLTYLSYAEEIARNHDWDERTAKSRISDWVAKGVELQEVRTRWLEVGN